MMDRPIEDTPIDFVNYVVGVDFGDAGDHAFWEAMSMAKRQRAVILHVVHVVPENKDLAEQERAIGAAQGELASYVRDHGRGITGSYEPRVVPHVRVGDAAQAMLQLAVDVNADLIILGATATERGLSFRKLLHHSAAPGLMRAARCPVLIAYPKDYSELQESEHIEPPCPACTRVQTLSGGERLWCDEHSKPRVPTRTWGPTDLGTWNTHDSEAIPTGVAMIRGDRS
jgi:nucleotide-binding universal stress UspA family protein